MKYTDAAGLITVGTGHTGIPVAAGVPSALALASAVVYDAGNVFQWLIAEAFDTLWQNAVWYAVALVDGTFYLIEHWLVNLGMGYLETQGPTNYPTDLLPTSSFITQLPTNLSNSHTLSVTMNPGFNGDPIALHPEYTPEEADDLGEEMAFYGYDLMGVALELQDHIDWEHEYADLAFDAVVSVANIGADLVHFPLYWCGPVTSSHFNGVCGPHDGLVPVSRQSLSGATNSPLPSGPPHTKETTHSGVISFIGDRLCDISGEC